MARKKKETNHFQVIDEKIILEEKDIANLSEEENIKIAFYVKTLGYELIFVEPEPKKNNYFTVKKAEKYLRRNKEALRTFNEFKEEANRITEEYKELKKKEKEGGKEKPTEAKVREARKAMISAQKDAFIAQKQWFKETYGIDVYDKVRKEY